MRISSDGYVLVTEITEDGSEGDGGLLCITDRSNCCRNIDGRAQGEWYFPAGGQVPTEGTQKNAFQDEHFFFRNRNEGIVRLNRRGDPPERGRFRCEVPNASGATVTLYVNIGE